MLIGLIIYNFSNTVKPFLSRENKTINDNSKFYD